MYILYVRRVVYVLLFCSIEMLGRCMYVHTLSMILLRKFFENVFLRLVAWRLHNVVSTYKFSIKNASVAARLVLH